jgi:hypothetical protein
MAAIVPATLTGGTSFRRTGTAQADTGQTDWFNVPQWAKYMEVILNITAVAGTTPIATPDIKVGDPVARDDGSVMSLGTLGTPPTAAGTHRIVVGPGVTGIADDVTLAATGDSAAHINTILSPLMGVTLTLDRAEANETYTYSLSVQFRS